MKLLLFLVSLFFIFTVSCTKDDEENLDEPDYDVSTPDTVTNPDSDSVITTPDDDNGHLCTPNNPLRCKSETEAVQCSSDGLSEIEITCENDKICSAGQCVKPDAVCTPGEITCNSADMSAVYKCNSDGSGYETEKVEQCDSTVGSKCSSGKCVSLCETAEANRSYEGCEYFSAVLHNGRDDDMTYEKNGFAFAFANTSDTLSATVTVTRTSDGVTESHIGTFEVCVKNENPGIFEGDMKCDKKKYSDGDRIVVPAKQVITVELKETVNMLHETGVTWNSYHIVSSIPLTVYQFNPIDNQYSNDASLVLPSSRMGTEYVVASYEDESGASEYDGKGFFTIIGVSDTDVELAITPTAKVVAKNGIPEVAAGSTFNMTIKKHQVINIETGVNKDDFTGTLIRCKDKDNNCAPFVVFGGHGCADIPRDKPYCDHIEHQLTPTEMWGNQYLVVKTEPKGSEKDMVRVIAYKDGTEISITNPLKTMSLNKGEYYEYRLTSTNDYEPDASYVTSNNPVQVVHYLTGSTDISYSCADENSSHDGCYGDPAMTVVPPIEQYRSFYIFLTPGTYDENYASVTIKNGGEITIDGEKVKSSDMVSIAGTDYSFAIVSLSTSFDQHIAECSSGCGLMVYGWEMDVSYMYPGGLDLKMLR